MCQEPEIELVCLLGSEFLYGCKVFIQEVGVLGRRDVKDEIEWFFSSDSLVSVSVEISPRVPINE